MERLRRADLKRLRTGLLARTAAELVEMDIASALCRSDPDAVVVGVSSARIQALPLPLRLEKWSEGTPVHISFPPGRRTNRRRDQQTCACPRARRSPRSVVRPSRVRRKQLEPTRAAAATHISRPNLARSRPSPCRTPGWSRSVITWCVDLAQTSSSADLSPGARSRTWRSSAPVGMRRFCALPCRTCASARILPRDDASSRLRGGGAARTRRSMFPWSAQTAVLGTPPTSNGPPTGSPRSTTAKATANLIR